MGRFFRACRGLASIGNVALLAAAACLFAVVACAAPMPIAEMRIVVDLVDPTEDRAALARAAARVAQLPARYVAAVSPSRHALALACDDPAACAQALRRLRADSSLFRSVEIDARRVQH